MSLVRAIGRPEWVRVLTIAVLAFVPRLVFLDADPPPDAHFHFINDEGLYAHNARLHALTGRWTLGDANPVLFTAPLHTLALRASYALFGTGLWPTRLPGALAGALTCLVLYAFVRREASRAAAFAAALLLASSAFLVANSRIAFTESLQVLFVTTAALAVLRSRAAPEWGAAGAAALAAALAAKLASLPAVALIAAQYALMWRDARGRPAEAAALRRSAAAFAGAAVAIAVVVALVAWPHARTVMAALADAARVANAGLPDVGLVDRALWFGYRDEPGAPHVLNGFWAGHPVLVLAVAVLAVARLLGRDPRPVAPLERACWLWVVVMFAGIATHPFYAPDRRYVLLMPPLAVLLACAARDATGSAAAPRPAGRARVVAAWLVGGFALGLYLRPALVPALAAATAGTRFGREVGLSGDGRLAALWALAFVLAAVAIRTWRRWSLAGLPALALIVGIVTVNGFRVAAPATHPRYTVREAARAFGRLASGLPPERRVAVGVTAATLALESDVIAVPRDTWPAPAGPSRRADVARLSPAFSVRTLRNGRPVAGDEGFSDAGAPVVWTGDLWPDAAGRPGLRTTVRRLDGWPRVTGR